MGLSSYYILQVTIIALSLVFDSIRLRSEPGMCLRRSAQSEQSPAAWRFHLAERAGDYDGQGSRVVRRGLVAQGREWALCVCANDRDLARTA